MRANNLHIAAVMMIAALHVPFVTRAAAPEYAPVKAALQVERDGLGNVFAKLEAGGVVNIAYLGGSITAANGWRVKTTQWLKERFPKANIHEIHAAIGGTGSDLGVFRLEHDVLRHKPDMMFVEFSVNDGGAAPEQIWRAMEGIVRQTWAANPRCDICFVYTFRVGYEDDLHKGLCPRAASADEMLAQHYGIPSINMALRTVELESDGKLVFKGERDNPPAADKILFSTDGVHPLDAGHDIYTKVIGDAITAWRSSSKPIDHGAKLAHPFVTDHWQDAHMEPIDPAMCVGNWTKLSAAEGLGKQFGSRMGDIWQAEQPGAKLRIRFRGSAIKLYDLLGPDGGQVIITVDRKTRPNPVPRFDSYCTYHRLATLSIADNLNPDEVHEVQIEVHPEQPDRQPVAFRLKDPAVELKSAKYQGTRVRIGGILLRGELVN